MGERGPAALRPWRRLRVPAHRATSEVLAVAYPFLAERGLGSRGSAHRPGRLVGHGILLRPLGALRPRATDQPNMFLAGQIGRGQVGAGQVLRLPLRSPSAGGCTCPVTPRASGRWLPAPSGARWSSSAQAGPPGSTPSTRGRARQRSTTPPGGCRCPSGARGLLGALGEATLGRARSGRRSAPPWTPPWPTPRDVDGTGPALGRRSPLRAREPGRARP